VLADIASPELRAKLAPPRVAWEKGYGQLIAREIHDVAELQEASRLVAFEAQNRTFERAYVAFLSSDDEADKQRQRGLAAEAAAKLGLYIRDPERHVRVSFASTLSSATDAGNPELARTLADAMQTRGLRTL
jgi:hypothetical protein